MLTMSHISRDGAIVCTHSREREAHLCPSKPEQKVCSVYFWWQGCFCVVTYWIWKVYLFGVHVWSRDNSLVIIIPHYLQQYPSMSAAYACTSDKPVEADHRLTAFKHWGGLLEDHHCFAAGGWKWPLHVWQVQELSTNGRNSQPSWMLWHFVKAHTPTPPHLHAYYPHQTHTHTPLLAHTITPTLTHAHSHTHIHTLTPTFPHPYTHTQTVAVKTAPHTALLTHTIIPTHSHPHTSTPKHTYAHTLLQPSSNKRLSNYHFCMPTIPHTFVHQCYNYTCT